MQLGKLNRRVIIERATVTKDALGVEIETWNPLFSSWAALRFDRGTQQREADTLNSSQSAVFTMRWGMHSRDVTTRDRIIWDGRAWDITAAMPQGFNDFIDFAAVAKVEGT